MAGVARELGHPRLFQSHHVHGEASSELSCTAWWVPLSRLTHTEP